VHQLVVKSFQHCLMHGVTMKFNRFIIYHQNIRGLKGKINKFMLSLPAEAPHLICFNEHHLKDYELNNTHIPKYKLGANCCTKNLK